MKYINKWICTAPLVLFIALTGCKENIDESNLYTFTGETIEDFLTNRSETFSSFNYILQRAGLDKLMSAYGRYTCFAPVNDAVEEYIDSLYDDTTNEYFEHNGMTSRSLEGLSDSLCNDIAKFHIVNSEVLSTDMNNSMTITTMLGRDLSTTIDSVTGQTSVNVYSLITSMDNETENGIVQVIDHVIRRSNRLMYGELQQHEGYSIFLELMEKTGLSDSLTAQTKSFTYPEAQYFYIPSICYMGYTVFLESDSVLAQNGINSFSDLVSYANDMYAECSEWYDYMSNNSLTVSTDGDYTNQWNAVNMFLRYHIIKKKVPYSNLIWYPNNSSSSIQPYEYYETLLPYTLLKVERVSGNKLYINRYKQHNTLTNQVTRLGSESMHTVANTGILIENNTISALNGYFHPINGLLAYERYVPENVLNERMRFDDASLMWELENNSLREVTGSIINALYGGKTGSHSASSLGGNYVQIPSDFFDNMVVYNGENTVVFYLPGMENGWSNYQKDEFNCIGVYDFAFRLPPVPDGTYELRVGYTANSSRGMVQFYLGNSSKLIDMKALDIPLDMRILGTNVNVGWVDYTTEDDYGVSTDRAMHNRGYMRGPLAYTVGQGGNVARKNSEDLRRVITLQHFNQGEYWLRFKSVLPDNFNTQFHLDYIEFCPTSVYNNPTYLEDMF